MSVPSLSLELMPETLARELAGRVERLGYLGEFFQKMAHESDALRAFIALTEASSAALGLDLTDLVALTTSAFATSSYEANQRERLCVHHRRSLAWIAAVERLDPDRATELTERERAAQRTTLALVRDHGRGAEGPLALYAADHGAGAAVALLFAVGRGVAHALIANALALAPPVPSIFEDGFDG